MPAAVLFQDPKPQAAAKVNYARATEYNSRHANLTLQPGTLVLFPAWQDLSVPANGGGQDRIIVGFDITLVD